MEVAAKAILVLDAGQADFTATGLRISSTLRLHCLMTMTTVLIRRELGELSPHLLAKVARKL